MDKTKETTTRVREGLYEFKGFTFRDCSDDYQRAWAIERDGKHIRGCRTIKDCKTWVNSQ